MSDMGEWMAIEEWHRCAELARPGIAFEIRNAEGQTLLAPCTVSLPDYPFDWKSPGTAFRAVIPPPPVHSDPIPAPQE